jgi:hypothetical protein
VKGFYWENFFAATYFLSFSFRFFYKPITLTALAFGLIVLAYVATTQDVLEEGQDKRRVYVFLALSVASFNSSKLQWGLCSYCCFFNVLNDPISRWTIHKAPSRVLAYDTRC